MPASSKISNKTLYGHVGMIIATLIWGIAGAVIKYTLDYIPPITFLFLRFLIASIVLLPYVSLQLLKEKVNPKDYFNLFLLGVFSQTALVFYFIGINYSTVLDATILGIASSIASVYAGHYFYHENVNKNVSIGLGLASIGTIVVILEPLFSQLKNHLPIEMHLWGNLLIVINSITWIFYVIWSKMSTGHDRSSLLKKTLSFIHLKPMKKTYSPILIVSISFYVGLITICPLAILENLGILGDPKIQNFDIWSIPAKGIAGLMYMALLSSVVAYCLYQWSLERVKVSDSALYGYMGSIFSFIAAYFLLGEVPNKYMALGGLLIVAGIILAERHPLRK